MQAEPLPRSRRTSVLLAAAVVVALGGLLAVRLAARETAVSPPAATVRQPDGGSLSMEEVPCWSCPSAKQWPLRFRTDLDLLAPLGDGPGNAAEFFAGLRREDGSRSAEAAAFMDRRRTLPGLEDCGSVVPFDDPLLLEAEPWVDQAEMDFYPDFFRIEGWDTRIPELLVMLTMARTWTARGVSATDPQAGLEDCRRAIRLGRLLRQEDAVLINDLVGLACVHIGTRGVYDIARRTDDKDLALLAAIVLGEVAPQRLYTAQRMTAVELRPYMRRSADGKLELDLPAARFDATLEKMKSLPDRRLRAEAVLQGFVILNLGTPEQRERMRAVLDELASGDDPVLASLARWVCDTEPTQELLSSFAEEGME